MTDSRGRSGFREFASQGVAGFSDAELAEMHRRVVDEIVSRGKVPNPSRGEAKLGNGGNVAASYSHGPWQDEGVYLTVYVDVRELTESVDLVVAAAKNASASAWAYVDQAIRG